MKKIDNKFLAFTISILIFLGACSTKQNETSSQLEEHDFIQSESIGDASAFEHDSKEIKKQSKKSKIVEYKIYEKSTGMLMATMPIPDSWVENTNRTETNSHSFSSKSGVKVFEYPYQMFLYTSDPYMRQIYQQAGQPIKAVESPEQIVHNTFVPFGQKQGLKLIKTYPVPELAQVDRTYDSKLYKVMPSQTSFSALASEWEDEKGNKSLIVIRHQVNSAQGLTYWSYYCNALEAPVNQFESAKNDLIFALLNVKHNPEQIALYNQREANKAQQSNTQFQQRMSQNQANFNAQQKAFRESNDAINNSMMSTWRSQNESSDRGQDQFLNYIRDENTMTNTNTGQTYQVESGANQYWMNNDGEYIMSNDYNYNPNQDVNTYQQDWTELENNY